MNSAFAKAIDAVFLAAIPLLESLEQTQEREPVAVQRQLQEFIDKAESGLRDTDWSGEWVLAKYALVAWLDEMLIDELEWPGREWWSNNVLEVHYFKSRLCNTVFFEKAREALSKRRLNAFEVYYTCVLLGFQGMYRNPVLAEQLAPELGLPPRLESLVAQAYRQLQLPRRQLEGTSRPPGITAIPLVSERLTRWLMTTAILLLFFNLALLWIH